MIILITGVAGFIGSHLAEKLLLADELIIGIDNLDNFYDPEIKRKNISSFAQNKNFIFYEGDVRNAEFLKKIFSSHRIDVTVHLAAKAGVRPSIFSPKEYYDVNMNGTINILESIKDLDVKKIVFASSSSVYGNKENIPFSENDNVDYPISPYAASKKAGELLCHSYYHLYGFDITCLRFFTVYGPRQRPDLAINKFASAILNDELITFYGNGNTTRDYTYIDDIVNGILKAIDHLNGYRIYNLGESKVVSLKQMVETLEKELNKKANLQLLPMQPGDVFKTCADISKARKELGYSPRWAFEDGIKEFVKWKLYNI